MMILKTMICEDRRSLTTHGCTRGSSGGGQIRHQRDEGAGSSAGSKIQEKLTIESAEDEVPGREI